jgi:hypothetical protein
MSCMLDDNWEPETVQDIIGPITWRNNLFIQLSSFHKADPDDIRIILNDIFQEDLSCLFCKVKEENDVLTFYGTDASLFSDLENRLSDAIYEEIIPWYNVEYKEFESDILIKLSVNYWDSLQFFKELIEESTFDYKYNAQDYLMDVYFTEREYDYLNQVLKVTIPEKELTPLELRRKQRREDKLKRREERRELRKTIEALLSNKIPKDLVESTLKYMELAEKDLGWIL